MLMFWIGFIIGVVFGSLLGGLAVALTRGSGREEEDLILSEEDKARIMLKIAEWKKKHNNILGSL